MIARAVTESQARINAEVVSNINPFMRVSEGRES